MTVDLLVILLRIRLLETQSTLSSMPRNSLENPMMLPQSSPTTSIPPRVVPKYNWSSNFTSYKALVSRCTRKWHAKSSRDCIMSSRCSRWNWRN